VAGNMFRPSTALAVTGAARLGVGLAMVAAPGKFFRSETGTEILLMRTIGIRDIAIGLGTCVAWARGGADNFRWWASIGLFSDSADAVTGLCSRPLVGSRGAAIAALSPVPFVAAAIFGLTRSSPKT
ncbi:hypothetical protein, partial [Mycolicibacterium sp. CBMA 361]|uniref:hypothetical protein n=1 Tax=Mycolicibacterium sp. CBMA 361 TaxID=2606610 RepID=UPI00193DC66E